MFTRAPDTLNHPSNGLQWEGEARKSHFANSTSLGGLTEFKLQRLYILERTFTRTQLKCRKAYQYIQPQKQLKRLLRCFPSLSPCFDWHSDLIWAKIPLIPLCRKNQRPQFVNSMFVPTGYLAKGNRVSDFPPILLHFAPLQNRSKFQNGNHVSLLEHNTRNLKSPFQITSKHIVPQAYMI